MNYECAGSDCGRGTQKSCELLGLAGSVCSSSGLPNYSTSEYVRIIQIVV